MEGRLPRRRRRGARQARRGGRAARRIGARAAGLRELRRLSVGEALAVLLAGGAAGAINVLVGSGTLITFPVLLAVGLSPVTANVSNTIGLVPGSFSGAWGYRRELAGQRGRVVRLGVAATLGGALGALALLVLPEGAFEAIVPAFIAVALVLIVLQPRISRRLAAGRPVAHDASGAEVDAREGPWTRAGMIVAGIYGGYFGAAQGILQLALLSLAFPREALQRLNAVKNLAAGGVNLVAGVVFVAVGGVDWLAAALIAVGSTAGGSLSGRYGRRIPPGALRALIVVVGIVAMLQLLT